MLPRFFAKPKITLDTSRQKQYYLYMKSILLFLTLLLASPVSAKTLKVGVVDSGLDLTDTRLNSHLCATGHKDFTGEGISDTVGHGTAMAGLIEQVAMDGDYCLVILKYYSEHVLGLVNLSREVEALRYAAKNGIVIVNLSGGGPEFDEREFLAIRDNPDMIFVVSAGNDGKDLDVTGNEYYPASYYLPNQLIIGNISNSYQRSLTSNYGKKVDTTEIGENVIVPTIHGFTTMTGTSVSTAIFTGKLIRKILDAVQPIRK